MTNLQVTIKQEVKMQDSSFIKVQSILDEYTKIAKNNWVVALGRKMQGKTLNTEHAFLLVEGIQENGAVFIAKYELTVSKQGVSVLLINERTGTPTEVQKIFKDILWSKTPENIAAELQYNSDGWYKKSWAVTAKQASTLIANIKEDEFKTIPYSISGIESVSGSSNSGSSKSGHNCFTWARQKLRDLKEPRINEELESGWMDKLVAVTSRHVGPKEEAKSGSEIASDTSSFIGKAVRSVFGW